jgi:hypothetical protein
LGFGRSHGDGSIAQPDLDDIYTTRVVVTGKMKETDRSASSFVLKTFSSKLSLTLP